MSRYLYLVRHGEQVDAEFGLPEGPLSERGLEQAALVADRLASVRFDAAYTRWLSGSPVRNFGGRWPRLLWLSNTGGVADLTRMLASPQYA